MSLTLNLTGRCDCCGAPPVMGFYYCEEHIYSTLKRWDSKNYKTCGHLPTKPFVIHEYNTVEGKIQRLAFSCISSIAQFEGRDAASYLGGVLDNPTRITRSI